MDVSYDAASQQTPRLLDQLRDRIRLKHYSIRTEDAYVDWVRRFVLFHAKRHPAEMGVKEVEAFLTHLAVQGNVAASTQNQAKSALLFLYREVLGCELPWLDSVESAKRPQRLPVVLTEEEVQALLARMSGTTGLVDSPDISPGHPRIACRCTPANAFQMIAAQDTLALGLRGFRPVLDGHLGHARLANRMIYWPRRSSPTWLARNDPQIRVLMKYPG